MQYEVFYLSNLLKKYNLNIHVIVSRVHENSEAKKGSRFSFSVDSLLRTVDQTKKPPTQTYSMLFLPIRSVILYSINYKIVSQVHKTQK